MVRKYKKAHPLSLLVLKSKRDRSTRTAATDGTHSTSQDRVRVSSAGASFDEMSVAQSVSREEEVDRRAAGYLQFTKNPLCRLWRSRWTVRRDWREKGGLFDTHDDLTLNKTYYVRIGSKLWGG